MRRRIVWVFAVAVLFVGLSGCSVSSRPKAEEDIGGRMVTLLDLPSPVQTTVQRLIAEGTIRKIEREQKGNAVIYDVEATLAGKDVSYDIDSGGNVLTSEESVPHASLSGQGYLPFQGVHRGPESNSTGGLASMPAPTTGPLPVRSYSTNFPLDEAPISEGGNWLNGGTDGIDWYDVITGNGVACGAVSAGAYTDPTALLTGTWGRNQIAKATVYSQRQTERYYQEVEIRLRSTLKAHRCTGYEVFWRCLQTRNAYAEIVKWNGKVGEWTSLQKNTGSQYGVKDGDVVEASIVGDVIKGYVNGVEVISAVDGTYSGGSPGIGFNYGVGDTNRDFGFSSFKVDTYDD